MKITCTAKNEIQSLHLSSLLLYLEYSFLLDPLHKTVPLLAWTGPKGSRKLGFPDFITTAQGGGKFVSLTHRLPLTPGNTPGTHFCLRLNRPQGHSAIGRIMSMKNSNDTSWDRTSDFPICSTAP